MLPVFFFFQAEDGIRDLVRSRGLGDVYKRQIEVLQNARRAGSAQVETTNREDGYVIVRDDGQGLSLIHI